MNEEKEKEKKRILVASPEFMRMTQQTNNTMPSSVCIPQVIRVSKELELLPINVELGGLCLREQEKAIQTKRKKPRGKDQETLMCGQWIKSRTKLWS